MKGWPGGLVLGSLVLGLGVFPTCLLGQAAEAPPAPDRIPGLLAGEAGAPATEADRMAALAAIQARASALSQESATRWLQLLALVEKSGSEAGALAARAVLAAEEGEGEDGIRALETGLDEVPTDDRPALLALAAHLADPVDAARAAGFRGQLLKLDPDAAEAPEAGLRLARHLAGRGGDPDRAVEVLEALIVANPNHPVAPEARRLLQSVRNP